MNDQIEMNAFLGLARSSTDEVIRYISARRATSYEEEVYYKEIGQ